MPVSLIDELDATFHELDELAEEGEQIQTYDRALQRVRYLASNFALLTEDVERMRASLPSSMWFQLQRVLMQERPKEIETIGRALAGEDEQFVRLISYVGFARGALAALADVAMAREP